MNKIIDYKVLRSHPKSSSLPWIEERVKALMKEGWQPIGGVAFNEDYERQAMVKYEEESDEDKGVRSVRPFFGQ